MDDFDFDEFDKAVPARSYKQSWLRSGQRARWSKEPALSSCVFHSCLQHLAALGLALDVDF